jgi:hypothetical protein
MLRAKRQANKFGIRVFMLMAKIKFSARLSIFSVHVQCPEYQEMWTTDIEVFLFVKLAAMTLSSKK